MHYFHVKPHFIVYNITITDIHSYIHSHQGSRVTPPPPPPGHLEPGILAVQSFLPLTLPLSFIATYNNFTTHQLKIC